MLGYPEYGRMLDCIPHFSLPVLGHLPSKVEHLPLSLHVCSVSAQMTLAESQQSLLPTAHCCCGVRTPLCGARERIGNLRLCGPQIPLAWPLAGGVFSVSHRPQDSSVCPGSEVGTVPAQILVGWSGTGGGGENEIFFILHFFFFFNQSRGA